MCNTRVLIGACRWVALRLLIFVAALVVGTRAFAAESTAPRPNILFIVSDDHSVPHLGCYGDPAASTPNLDNFAREGMIFDKQFCVAPQCVPSRAGFLAGCSAVKARITRFSSPLPPDVQTLPDLLKSNGYYTGVCRRCFHLDGPLAPNPIVADVFARHPELRTFANRVDFLDVSEPRTKTVSVVTRFLDSVPADKPFFLWLSLDEPHHPWDVQAPKAPTEPSKVRVPASLPDIPEVRRDLARYEDEISALDEEFQWVMDLIDQRGLAANTMVVFVGDNGYAFPHGKGSLYDPGLNTPLLVRWPGHIQAGSRRSELISGEDLAPTLLEAAGVAVPHEMTGRSFLPCLKGEKFEARKYVFAERGPHGNFGSHTKTDGVDFSRCVRSKRYKLIYNCTPNLVYWPIDSGDDPYWQAIVKLHEQGNLAPAFVKAYFTSPRPVFELYDLEKDPDEMTNLAGRKKYAKIQRVLRAALQEKMILDYDYLPLPAGN